MQFFTLALLLSDIYFLLRDEEVFIIRADIILGAIHCYSLEEWNQRWC